MLNRAYSRLEIKSLDAEKRVITGIATTPTPDRVNDVVEPLGVKFKNPLSLLLFHDSTNPVGTVKFDKPTKDGVSFQAHFPEIQEEGLLRDQVERAWQLVKYKLVRGVSIGFRAIDDAVELLRTGGLRFLETEVVELSLVSVPANAEATIQTIKSLDESARAALGQQPDSTPAGVTAPRTATPVRKVHLKSVNKPIADQIKEFEATRETKRARMTELMTKSADAGVTLDEAESEEYDRLEGEIETVNKHIQRLQKLEAINKAAAVPVNGKSADDANKSRDPQTTHQQINVTAPKMAPGIEFTQMVLCKVASFLEFQRGNFKSALDIAKERYPSNERIQLALKAAVPPAMTTVTSWAGALVDPTNLANEFVEFLRPQTILGKFGQNGVPSLNSAPFNSRFIGETNDGDAYWVGQGKPKPLTRFGYEATTIGFAKLAAIAVITQETARFSSPKAVELARNSLAKAIRRRMDIDFIDPAKAAVSNVSPASITNGLSALPSAGSSADNVRTDLGNLLEQYIATNQDVGSLVLIMPNTLTMVLSLMRNSLGNKEFPDLSITGGTLEGIPVIASQYAANGSGAGNLVIAVNADEIFLADDGSVTVDVSTEASVEMSDTPTQNGAAGTGASLVSFWQNNLIGLRAERFVNWQKRRDEAVVYMDDVNWGSIGSPA